MNTWFWLEQVFSQQLVIISLRLWHLVTPGDRHQGTLSRSSEAETIILLCCLWPEPGGHPARRTSGVSWKWKSDGVGEQRVICNFLDVYKLPGLVQGSQQVGGTLTPFIHWFCPCFLWKWVVELSCQQMPWPLYIVTSPGFKKKIKSRRMKNVLWHLDIWYFTQNVSEQVAGVRPWPGEICEFVTQYALYVIKNFILYAGSGPPAGNSSNAAFFSLCCCPFGILWCINILWPMAHRCGHLMVVGFTTNNI